MAVIVSTPTHTPGRVELVVATGSGAVLLDPAEAREVAARPLVASDAIESVPPLGEALGGAT
jgi:hypothetical protein